LVGGIVVNLAVIVFHKAGARRTGHDNIFRILKILDEFIANFFGFTPVPCIESRLTATCLFGIVMNSATSFFKNFDGIESCIGKQLINEAWYENVDVHLIYNT